MNQLEKWEGEIFGFTNETGQEFISFRFRLGSGTLLTMCMNMEDFTIEDDAMKYLNKKYLIKKGLY